MSDTNIFDPRITWTDKSFALNRGLLGIQNKPDYDFVNLGLLFPQNDTAEKIYIVDQMDHRKVLGQPLYLHVHFIQDSADLPNFACDYRFYKNGDQVPGAFTTIETDNGDGPLFTYVSGSILQLVQFPIIPAPPDEAISANLEMIIYRNDNRVTGDVLTKYVDYHYQITPDGSRMPFSK